MTNRPLALSQLTPFAKGGQRACYLDPNDRDKVLKVPLPEKSPQERRDALSFPKNLRPLHYFDDNEEEYRNLKWIERKWGQVPLIPKLYGKVPTDLGTAISTELFRDANGQISKTLEYYLWQDKCPQIWLNALDQFTEEWLRYSIPTRSLMLYNLVVVKTEDNLSIKLIDDFGLPELIPFVKFSPRLRRAKVSRRVEALSQKVERLFACKEERPGHNQKYRNSLLRRNKMLAQMDKF